MVPATAVLNDLVAGVVIAVATPVGPAETGAVIAAVATVVPVETGAVIVAAATVVPVETGAVIVAAATVVPVETGVVIAVVTVEAAIVVEIEAATDSPRRLVKAKAIEGNVVVLSPERPS